MSVSDVVGTPASEHPEVVARADRHVPGEPGIWVLLFGDMLVFTILFAVYLHRRGENKELFAQSQEALNRSFGAINTLVLLTSSVLVVFAVRALRSEQSRHLAYRLTVAGAGVGACFVVIKVFEYHEKVAAGITPSTNEFFMYYFVLTGLHLAHVIVGLGVLLALSRLARKPAPTHTHIAFFEGGGCFWHMVDLLWIVIFPLLFLVR
jgi:nitric oxide reductase NorE protein